MWDTAISTGLAAAMAATIAVPAVRRLGYGSINHDWLAGEIDLDGIVTDGKTLRLKTGGMLRVFRVRGVSYDAKLLEQQNILLKGRSQLFHKLGSLGLPFWLFGVKRRRRLEFTAAWPSPVLKEIGEAEKTVFKSAYYVDWYLVIGSTSLSQLNQGTTSVKASISDYKPELLSRAEPGRPCLLTAFANYLVSGEWNENLPAISDALSGNLPAADLNITRDGIIAANVPTRQLHQIIAIRNWPDEISGQIISDLLSIEGDIEVCQMCEPWDRDKLLLILGRKKIEQNSALFGNSELVAEIEALIQLLTAGNTTAFDTQFQIVCRAADESSLNTLLEKVGQALGRRRVVYSVETGGGAICWFARIPKVEKRKLTDFTKLLRPLLLRDQNIAALWPFQHSSTGRMRGPFGPQPVRYLHTASGQVFAFQFHVVERKQSPGNFLVFASTGAGKSTLILHILGGLAKFAGVRSYLFDSKEGARFMVESMGGLYMGYDELRMNPLDVGTDTPKNRQRILKVLRAMAGEYQRGQDDDAVFNHAMNLAFQLDQPERTLNAIFELAFQRQTPLRHAYAPWVVDDKGNKGVRSHLMNAPHDTLGSFLSASHMVGINMNEALDDPTTGPPIVTHISAAIGDSAARDSRGFGIFIDEAAKLLQNDGFRALAMEMYREYRKLDGLVGMAFQDPQAMFKSGVGEAFLENTTTLIFFPNSQANREGLERFNLNDEQIAFVLGEGERKEEDERRVLVVQRDAATGLDESAIIDVNLKMLGDALRHYRAGPEANRHLADIKQKWGPLWQQHL